MSEMLMRVLTCKSIHERIKSTLMRPINNTNCATRTRYTKFRFCVFIPTSTTLCVRKGKISCNNRCAAAVDYRPLVPVTARADGPLFTAGGDRGKA